MLRVCLQFVVVVFPDHTHFLFSTFIASTEHLVTVRFFLLEERLLLAQVVWL